MDMSYSQSGEDLIIAEYFGEFKGKLLDIGANDGVTFSNSRVLIESGWGGVLIEPSLAYGELTKLYADSPMVKCKHYAISSQYGEIVLCEMQDSLLSTTTKSIADSWGVPYTLRIVTTVPYSAVADKYDFITIDTEWSDWVILQQIDLSYTKCLCIEYGQYESEITDYCKMFHMKLLHKNGENLIFVK